MKTSFNLQQNIPQETKTFIVCKQSNNNPLISSGTENKLRLKGVRQNFPFALQRRVNPQHLTKMLRLSLQSEIETSDNALNKRNF